MTVEIGLRLEMAITRITVDMSMDVMCLVIIVSGEDLKVAVRNGLEEL